ncbi:uncharacterized protein BDZ83DRAFT_619926 [Colletotrichum acutatum]|uniref:Uncharacterized protein n=1 Tax=Glomerella acutata TaxID=27357 RepID=A0AAD8UM43_GLOAC|nr:uncharacterized protein BDZ83DRAFT_619926 [Colletotrichum acutatum]KAK1725347.1 hypothetical protein BDZ83DRAFT_619926 [Colletotrichum acutatum]
MPFRRPTHRATLTISLGSLLMARRALQINRQDSLLHYLMGVNPGPLRLQLQRSSLLRQLVIRQPRLHQTALQQRQQVLLRHPVPAPKVSAQVP